VKITAIRGENLASLEQPFQIDLLQGPLSRSGLFAITGPTGAGKSTLLDAVCLCLYDKTPRFEKQGGATVVLAGQDADAALSANDQRNILRRGAGSGWAEVDFHGRDGRTWTARWEVRRARKRAQGKVQQQTLSLRDDQGQLLGGTKTETLDAIRARVGLDFDQFRRSVLLAQGDFAAFLRADQNERAELLEQMTGTDIYGRLAAAAFGERRRLEGRHKELQTRRQEVGVLDGPGRAAAELALDQVRTERQVAVAQVQTAEQAVRWHEQQAALDAAVLQAHQALDQARAAWQAAQDRRGALDRAERGWPLRALAAQAHRARQQAHAALGTQAAVQRALDEASREESQARQGLAAAQARLARARQALVVQLEDRLATARAAQAELAAWRTEHPQHLRMADAERVQDIAARLQRWAAARATRDELAARLPAQVSALDALEATRLAAAAARDAADQVAVEARQALDQAAAQAPGPEQDAALQARRVGLDRQGRALAELQRLSDQAQVLTAGLHQAVADRELAQGRADAARARVEAAQLDSAALGPRLDEARQALAQARAALDATALRETLVEGRPCAVCGSTEHPWATGSPLAGLHAQQQDRVQELETRHQALLATAAREDATARAALQSRDEAEQAAARSQARLDALAGPWQQASEILGALAAPGPALAAVDLAGREQALGREQQELAEQEAALRQARALRDQAQAALQAALVGARAAADTLAARQQDATQGARSLEQLRLQDQGTATALAELESELDAVLVPAQAELPEVGRWRQQPGPALAACRAAGTTWRQREQRQRQAAEAEAELDARLGRDRDRAEQALAETRTEDLALVPAVVPPALDPPSCTAWLDDRVAADQALRERAVLAARQSLDLLGTARQQQATAAATATALKTGAEAAERNLAEQGLALDLDATALAWLMDLPQDWPAAERAALQALQAAPDRAETLLAERRERLQAHADTRPSAPAEDATQALADARQDQARLDEAWSAARATVQADDAARTRLGALDQELAEHERLAHPWLRLAACIAPDTVSFKRFAQSLTLELLLEQANHHLRELHPRYSLARIHGTDLELLIVDHDLGDEPRTVQSLSGGESFLVSLALALGLSSLSSRDVRVESLFIDEGFGSLDGRTLDTALAVLDSLQAGGRQVGVISHVGGLAERIGVQVRVEPQGGGRSLVRVEER